MMTDLPVNSATAGAPQRVPPQSIPAEACVLGSMILDSTCVDIIVQMISDEHFYRPAHQLIYKVLTEMKDLGAPIDLVTVKEELLKRKQLEQIGGVEYLADLVTGVPNAASAEYYTMIVRNKALLRMLIAAGTEIVNNAYDSREEAIDIIDRAEQTVFEISSDNVAAEITGMKELLQHTFEMLEQADGREITGVPTGYHRFDDMTCGLHGGEMIILAARPSMGKTSLLLNIAEHMGATEQAPIALFSLEMSKEQLAQRLLASRAQFDLQQMRRGNIQAEDWTQLQRAAAELENAPIFIDDSPELTVMQLRAKARRLKAAHDIKCVLIDYLQLMSYHGRAENRQAQVGEMSRGLKALARELDVPVIVAAQLNRGPADRPSHTPRMSDLRESGSIEQDADVVSLLHLEDYYHRGEPDYINTNITQLIIAKQRNGPTGIVDLTFIPQCTRFVTAAPAY
ncbi:MAG: replicative DNA helicase [Phycisphaerales bacterium]|nr:replicative DNA helicase [Phycisphaerales bacterium]